MLRSNQMSLESQVAVHELSQGTFKGPTATVRGGWSAGIIPAIRRRPFVRSAAPTGAPDQVTKQRHGTWLNDTCLRTATLYTSGLTGCVLANAGASVGAFSITFSSRVVTVVDSCQRPAGCPLATTVEDLCNRLINYPLYTVWTELEPGRW